MTKANNGNAIVVHGGGPSAVLNASLMGIAEAWRGGALFGARFGALGIADDHWYRLDLLTEEQRERIRRAPGSVLGSSRRIFDHTHTGPALERLRERGVRTVFFTGGNGSMKTARLLYEADPSLTVIGVPKTVDNDLAGTHHSPGFGSAGRFYAYAVRDIGADNRALPSPVTIVEVIGRNAGWVTGATALARFREDAAPHLIYLPERPPTLAAICRDVQAAHERWGRAVVAVCEGLRDPDGNPFGAELDRAGNRQHELASNLGHTLARAVSSGTGLRVRAEKPGLLGRSCSLAVSEADARDAFRCGQEAVAAARRGETGVMVAFVDESRFTTVPLEAVAGVERLVPLEWINPEGNGVTEDFVRYAAPLVGTIDPLPILDE